MQAPAPSWGRSSTKSESVWICSKLPAPAKRMQRPAQLREPGQGVAGKTESMTDHNPDAGLQQRNRQG